VSIRIVERAVGRLEPMGAGDHDATATGAMAIVARPSGTGSPSGSRLDVRSPADGSVVASVPDQGAAEVRVDVARLRRYQPAWEALGPSGRGANRDAARAESAGECSRT
jgi:acyl-CoA reductase-like NAD-dependent aldehyde dehydrogenase